LQAQGPKFKPQYQQTNQHTKQKQINFYKFHVMPVDGSIFNDLIQQTKICGVGSAHGRQFLNVIVCIYI
jgi:hypothetical protein